MASQGSTGGRGAGDGNRTRTASLEGWSSTIELHPRGPAVTGPPPSVLGTLRVAGVWRSLVAHSLWERGAVGSNPATPTQSVP